MPNYPLVLEPQSSHSQCSFISTCRDRGVYQDVCFKGGADTLVIALLHMYISKHPVHIKCIQSNKVYILTKSKDYKTKSVCLFKKSCLLMYSFRWVHPWSGRAFILRLFVLIPKGAL